MNRRLFCSGLITAPALLAKPGEHTNAADAAPKPDSLLFQSDAIHELHVELDPRDWNRLRENVAAKDYYPAAVSWNGVSLPAVRLRARGRNSRNAAKPGLRVDLRAGGLPKVNGFVLHNLTNDPSGLHDWLAMQIFRKAGVAAPRRSFARVFVNREAAGLYTLGEELDANFLHRKFRESQGFLYQYHQEARQPARKAKRSSQARAVIEHGHLGLPGDGQPDLLHLARVLAAESFCDDRQGLLSEHGPDGIYLYTAKKPAATYVIPWGKELAFGRWQAPLWPQTGGRALASLVNAQSLGQELHRATIAKLSTLAGAGSWLEDKIQGRIHTLRPLVAADRRWSLAEYDKATADLLEFGRRRGELSGSYS